MQIDFRSWLRGALVCLLWTASARSAQAQATGADSARVTIRIRVLDHVSGAPIERAWIGAYDGSGSWPVANGNTAADGTLELRVPPDSIDVLVTKAGFDRQRRTVDAAALAGDARGHVFRLARNVSPPTQQVDSIWAELRRPTAVTPCRPFEGRAAYVLGLVRTAVLLDLFAQQGMPDLRFASVEHVIDRARCHAAIAAIERYHGNPRDGIQVLLFRLDYAGWAAIEPSPPGSVTVIYVLDWNLTRVRKGFGMH